MSPMNSAVRRALNLATGVLFQLEDRGCTVVDVAVRSARAVIVIDRPPAGIEGALHVRRRHAGLTERVMVAELGGCQLEWTETAPPARAAA